MEAINYDNKEIEYYGEFIKNSVFNVVFNGAKGIKAGKKIVGVNLRFDSENMKLFIEIFADCGFLRHRKQAPLVVCDFDEGANIEILKNGIVQYLFDEGAFETFLNNDFSFTVDSKPAINKRC